MQSGRGGIRGIAEENGGRTHSEEAKRRQKLVVGGAVVEGQLRRVWSYSREVHERRRVEELARWYKEEVEGIVERSGRGEKLRYVPADFPMAGVDQTTLDQLVARRDDIEDIYPLSPIQEGTLFRSQYDENSREYFNQISCTIRGDFDVDALKYAWQKIINRHSALRAGFFWRSLSRPLQIIKQQAALAWEEHSWIGMPGSKEELESFLRTDRERGFDLTTPS